MGVWNPANFEYMHASCFFLSIVSALVPWINGEILLLSFAALDRSAPQLVLTVVLASLGQMVGKCVLYWTARRTVPSNSQRFSPKVVSWMKRIERSSSRPLVLVFLSSTIGIPPFYVVSMLAGALHIRFSRFVGAGLSGRLVRFGLLVSIPELTLRFFWT